VSESHKVQSIRAAVEQTIADLKLAKVMEDNKISTVTYMEKVLDCVISLHNLRVLCKADENFAIPKLRAQVPGDHIFWPKVGADQVDLSIPANAPDLSLPNYKHIKDFVEFLPSAATAIKNAINSVGQERIFYPNVRKRGRNLYNGAYVLQLRVQDGGLGVQTVKYQVGASYSYEVHVGYFKMSRDNAAMENICDCYSGYVFNLSVKLCFVVLYTPVGLFFHFPYFFSARPCSHFFAVLLLLLDLNDPDVETLLVRLRYCSFCTQNLSR
jgi:hypothetical protein